MPALVVRLAYKGYNNRPDIYIDSNQVSWQDFEPALREKLALYPPHWPICLDGDPGMDWQYAVEAIDTIRGLGAEVILLSRQQRPVKMRDH